MEFHLFAFILVLLTVKTDKMELMTGENHIKDEHSIPTIITSDRIVKFFCEGLSCVHGPMETVYK